MKALLVCFLWVCSFITDINPWVLPTSAQISSAKNVTIVNKHHSDVIMSVSNHPRLECLLNHFFWRTWTETYFRQDLFPSYLFFRRQLHAIVIFRLKSIFDLDPGSLPRFLVNSYTQNSQSWCRNNDWTWNGQNYAHQWIGLGFQLGLVSNSVSSG